MTGRLTQDCVENLFSCIRGKGDAHPSPVHFRHNLKILNCSTMLRIVCGQNLLNVVHLSNKVHCVMMHFLTLCVDISDFESISMEKN